MSTTKKGDELADKLNPYIGTTAEIRETCSRICRHAATLHRLNEEECNGHPMNGNPAPPGAGPEYWERVSRLQERWEERVDHEQTRTVALMVRLVESLPDPDNGEGVRGTWKLEAETDPRGCSVILGPDFVRGDSWGDRNGICVP